MDKILNQCGLGSSSRQSEIIELALTHKFDAIEVDMADLLARYEAMGKQFALQFFRSARVKVGTFKLPNNFGAAKDKFDLELARLDKIIDLAKELNCSRCYCEIESGSDLHTFQENFENHRIRLAAAGNKLAQANIRLGITLGEAVNQCNKTYQFVRTADECLTLLRLVGNANVGLCLNTFNWTLGKGGLTQLANLAADKLTEVRFGDLPGGVAISSVNVAQTQLPGGNPDSIAADVMRWLTKGNYAGPISILVGSAAFSGKPRDQVFAQIANRLQQLLEIGSGKRSELGVADANKMEMASV